jgi:hypothetical protein
MAMPAIGSWLGEAKKVALLVAGLAAVAAALGLAVGGLSSANLHQRGHHDQRWQPILP